MTELEILERAKQYVTKLANGVDPITDKEVSETDVVNQVRVSRCLFYVADVLQQVIDNGGAVSGKAAPKKPKKKEFAISPEALAKFSFYSNPVSVSEIVRQLNDLSHAEDMKKLTYNQVAAWLLSEDIFFETAEASGRQTKRPTEKGRALGISTEKRTGQQGEYTVVAFDRQAQEFLLGRLPEILAFVPEKPEPQQADAKNTGAPKKTTPVRSVSDILNTPWTEDDDLFLRELYHRGASMGDMMLSLHRESFEITARIRALHLADET